MRIKWLSFDIPVKNLLFCQFYYLTLNNNSNNNKKKQQLNLNSSVFILWNQVYGEKNVRSNKPIICFARPHIFFIAYIFSVWIFFSVWKENKKNLMVSNSIRIRSNSGCWCVFILCAFFTSPVPIRVNSSSLNKFIQLYCVNETSELTSCLRPYPIHSNSHIWIPMIFNFLLNSHKDENFYGIN